VSRGGRPIRFLAVMLGGWTAARIAMLWPTAGSAIDAVDGVLPFAFARAASAEAAGSVAPGVGRTARRVPAAEKSLPAIVKSTPPESERRRPVPHRTAFARPSLTPVAADARAPLPTVIAAPPGLPLAPRVATRSRWSGSGWLVVRGQGRTGAAFGGSQLGGSQAGLRIAYTIDRTHRIAVAARLSTPLSGRGREAAVGLEWQPASLPIRIVAEQRVGLDHDRSGPAIGIVGGIGPVAVSPDITVEAYAQAGAIARNQVETFADGAARISHPLADIGETRVDFGIGAWGAAQRDAARLDIGPSLSADLPLGDRAHARLSLDWRARVAGDARPGSGLVLTLGTDF
jgi:hypothetical protein